MDPKRNGSLLVSDERRIPLTVTWTHSDTDAANTCGVYAQKPLFKTKGSEKRCCKHKYPLPTITFCGHQSTRETISTSKGAVWWKLSHSTHVPFFHILSINSVACHQTKQLEGATVQHISHRLISSFQRFLFAQRRVRPFAATLPQNTGHRVRWGKQRRQSLGNNKGILATELLPDLLEVLEDHNPGAT